MRSVYEPPAGRADAPKLSGVDQLPDRLISSGSVPPLVVKQAGLLVYWSVSCQLGLAEAVAAGMARAAMMMAAGPSRAAVRQCGDVMLVSLCRVGHAQPDGWRRLETDVWGQKEAVGPAVARALPGHGRSRMGGRIRARQRQK